LLTRWDLKNAPCPQSCCSMNIRATSSAAGTASASVIQ
jgi:hypothetical protein